MANLLYAYEKASEAVECLTTHEGRIRDRLIEACHNGFAQVGRKVLPDDLKPLYDEISSLVEGKPQPQLGAFIPAIKKLSEEEAQRAAGLMVELETRLGTAAGLDS